MNLRPVDMSKVRVIGLRRDLPKVVAALHESGLVEIREVNPKTLERETPGEEYREVSEQLIRLRGIENYLKKDESEVKVCERLSLKKALEEAKSMKFDVRLAELGRSADDIKERKNKLTELAKALSPFKNLNVDFSDFKSPRLKYSLGNISAKKLNQLRKALDAQTKNYSIVARHRTDKVFVLVAVENTAEIGTAFGEAGFVETDISQLSGKPAKIIEETDGELLELEKKLADIEGELLELSKKHYCRVVQLREMLEIEADRLEIVSKFGRTDELFVFEGYAQKSQMPKVRGWLADAVGKKILLQENEAGPDAPTLLEHGKVAGPLQFLVEFYALPELKEIDPTLVLF
ncbi:MAG: hypothetical protein V1909_04830, partial [Candidatus Micrarchaeota archaeon]